MTPRGPRVKERARARQSLRVRLALLYAGLTLLAGVILLATMLALVAAHDLNSGSLLGGTPASKAGAGLVVRLGIGGHERIRLLTLQALVLHQVLLQGLLALVIVLALAMVGGWVVAGRILTPLSVMTATAERISAENLAERIALAGPSDELTRLADSFDALLDRLDKSVAASRRFAANASHELRTPLAIQKTLLDVGLTDPAADERTLRLMGERLLQLNQRMYRLIEGLLTLAESEQPIRGHEIGNLARMAEDAVAAAEAEADSRQIRLEVEANEAPVWGDLALLERMVGNVVENGVRHNHDGGWVRVNTGALKEGSVLRVENSGPTVAEDELPGLFDPFRRGARDRTESARGAGLGFAIVRAVVAAHGGTVEVRPRPEGGLAVTVTLPTAPPHPSSDLGAAGDGVE